MKINYNLINIHNKNNKDNKDNKDNINLNPNYIESWF